MELGKEEMVAADGGLEYSVLTWNVLGMGKIKSRGWTELTP